MRIDDLTLEVRDGSLERVGQILPEDITDFLAVPRFNNVGMWELSLHADHPLVEVLRTPGSGIRLLGPQGVIISGSMLLAQKVQKTADPRGTWKFTGADDSIVLNRRLAYPNPAEEADSQSVAYDRRTGIAETVIKAYLAANIGAGAIPSRVDPRITVEPDLGRGSTVTGNARFVRLGELFSGLSVLSGLGFEIVQEGDDLQFRVYEPADRSAEIQMDIANDLLTSVEYGYGAPNATRVLVAGQGQGEERTIVEVTTTESLEAETVWGERIEVFQDRRDTDDLDELAQAGEETLAVDGQTITTLSVTPSDGVTMRYGVDWGLGDIVTVIVGSQPLRATVTEAIVRIGKDGVKVGATVGEPQGFDWRAQMSQRQQKTATRVSALERTAETAGIPVGTHLPGEWSTGAVPPGFVLANGAVLNIADYPKLAAHYAAVYGAANHHGGNGTTTFGVPDTRERVYVNQGGSDIFATIGAKLGAKTHTHPLSVAGYALISLFSSGWRLRHMSPPAWTANVGVASSRSGVSESISQAVELGGNTDASGSVQPSFVCRYVIRAA